MHELTTTNCPICKHVIEFCVDDTDMDVQCPHCLSGLRILENGKVLEIAEYMRPHICAAVETASQVAKVSACTAMLPVFLGLMCWIGGSQFRHLVWFALVPPLLIIMVFATRYPWIIPIRRGLGIWRDTHREQEIERQRRRADELWELKKTELAKLEAIHRQRQTIQAQVAAREQALREDMRRLEETRRREEQERLLRLTDGGYEECWRKINWLDFETAVLMFFEHIGCTIETATPPSKDGGLDGIIVDASGRQWGIQCKHLTEDKWVNAGMMRDFIGALVIAKIKNGYFISTSPFGKGAKWTARNASVASIETRGIKELIARGQGLKLDSESINRTKNRLGVPIDIPAGMYGHRRVKRQSRVRGRH